MSWGSEGEFALIQNRSVYYSSKKQSRVRYAGPALFVFYFNRIAGLVRTFMCGWRSHRRLLLWLAFSFGFRVPVVFCFRWHRIVESTRQASCDCVARTQESGPTYAIHHNSYSDSTSLQSVQLTLPPCNSAESGSVCLHYFVTSRDEDSSLPGKFSGTSVRVTSPVAAHSVPRSKVT